MVWMVIIVIAIIVEIFLLMLRHRRRRQFKSQVARNVRRFVEPVQKQEPIQHRAPTIKKDVFKKNTIHEDADSVLGIKQKPKPTTPAVKVKMPLQRVMLYLRAPESGVYAGYELMQSLPAAGLTYGEDNIFHFHEDDTETSPVLFSVAAATRIGIFPMDDMGGFTCPGLMFFLTLNDLESPTDAFEIMLNTMDQLIEDLDGQILDQAKNLMTQQKLTDIRKKIKVFEKGKVTEDLFAAV